jgi:hypothetical protein
LAREFGFQTQTGIPEKVKDINFCHIWQNTEDSSLMSHAGMFLFGSQIFMPTVCKFITVKVVIPLGVSLSVIKNNLIYL